MPLVVDEVQETTVPIVFVGARVPALPYETLPCVTGEYFFDPLITLMSYRTVGTQAVDGRYAIGRRAFQPVPLSTTEYYGHKPEAIPYSLSDDLRRNSNTFNNLSIVKDIDSIFSRAETLERDEHNVLHSKYKGIARRVRDPLRQELSIETISRWHSTAQFFAIDLPWYPNGYQPVKSIYVADDHSLSSGSTLLGLELRGSVEGLFSFFDLNFGEYSENLHFHFTSYKNRKVGVRYTSFSVTYSANGNIDVDYTALFDLYWTGYDFPSGNREQTTYVGHISFVRQHVYTGSQATGQVTVVNPQYVLSYWTNRTEGPGGKHGVTCQYNTSRSYNCDVSTTLAPLVNDQWKAPYELRPGINDNFPLSYKYPGRTLIDVFSTNVNNDIRMLYPATFYSTQDALSKYVKLMRANHIETISELKTISSLLPDIRPLFIASRAMTSGDAVNATKSVIDVITSLRLLQKFGLEPYYNNYSEFSENYDRIVRRLESGGIFGHKTLYGSFNFELPFGVYGLTETHLTVRSKVCISFSNSSLMMTILGGAATGLLPVLSNFWDLVPFSFVIDWFCNIGTRLSDIESQGFFIALSPRYCVHSVKVTTDFSEDTLESNLLSTDSERGTSDFPGVSYYRRFISVVLPPLLNSRYDFRAVATEPDVFTAGSLAWQVLL